jgi:hypothetical protein
MSVWLESVPLPARVLASVTHVAVVMHYGAGISDEPRPVGEQPCCSELPP